MSLPIKTLLPDQDTFGDPAFNLRNRLARMVWNIASLILFQLSPRPLHSWRSFILRCFGAKVGKGVKVYPGAKIWAPWNLQLDDECAVANGAILYSQGKIVIGRRTVISQGVHLVTGTHNYMDRGFPLFTKPIHIGGHVWIAAEAFVHPGVTINEGCVIGARAVVTKDMPAWMVCSGHPCRPIKERLLE